MRTHLFQYGCEEIARTIPKPIPRNVIPVLCMLKWWIPWKITGKAWKAR